MSDETKREWKFYIDDMIDFCQKINIYTSQLNLESFINSGPVYDGTLRNLELIGEAATNIPENVRKENPDIPWRQVIATRNRLIHGYLGIDDEILWSIIQDDIPDLIINLINLKRGE